MGTRKRRFTDQSRWSIAVVVSALLAGCASSGAPPAAYTVTTRTDAPPKLAPPLPSTVSNASASAASGPPSLPPARSTIVGMPSTLVDVNANGHDISEVIAGIAEQAGLHPVIDPSIHGPISATMHNISVGDAMERLIGDRYQYRVQNGALVVSPIRMLQQTYEVSYLQMARASQASTVVARNLTGASNTGIVTNSGAGSSVGTGVSSTSGGLVASGTDVIQSSSNSDVWGELKIGLETILFGGRGDSTGRGVGTRGSAIGGASASGECSSDGTCLNISPFASMVTVTAAPDRQAEVGEWLALFKAAITRQVYITAKVVEVTLDRSKNTGIDWRVVIGNAKRNVNFTTDPTGSAFKTDASSNVVSTGNASFNLGTGNVALDAVINALQSYGDVNILASPATTAMNQQKASFNVTQDVPFFTITKTPLVNATTGIPTSATQDVTNVQVAQVGVVLDVLPQISSDNMITMSIRPSVTSIVSQTPVKDSQGNTIAILPTTDRRETDTMARIRAGETIVIGGLIQTQNQNERHGIPGLMSLPYLGRLFSSTSVTEHHSEMVIFITPTIVSGQPPVGR
jgi:MSHA biogenesis protein MshL